MSGPAALTQAISVDPRVVGSAYGLYGFEQMTVGALCTTLAGLGSNPALAAAIVLAAAGTVAQIALRFGLLARKGHGPHGERERPWFICL